MKILVAPFLYRGHVTPHLALAASLRSAGHEVVFYSEAGVAPEAERVGCKSARTPFGGARRYLSGGKGFPAEALEALARRVAPHLLRLLARERINRIVTDGMHLGAALAAEASGLPWATLATTPAQVWERFQGSVFAQVETGALRQELGLPPTDLNSLRQCVSPQLFLLPWTSEFDLSPPPAQAAHVGPLVWDEDTGAKRPPWMRRLRSDRPIILATMASWRAETNLAVHERRYLSTLVTALNELPVQALIVIRAPITLEGVRPRAHVRLVPPFDHGLLMPRLSAMITHGGWGTVGRALTHGVPMIVVGADLDTPLNAELCERNGVGFGLSPETLTVETLTTLVRRIVARRSPVGARARAFRRRLRGLRPLERAARLVLDLDSRGSDATPGAGSSPPKRA
jgi:UDP:flavonoid glycosyltransferase YjiC (YdhE family)